MAKQEQDREDLLAEATAFPQRISLQLPEDDEPTLVGFRGDASASFYFGAGRVYHFTPPGQLRRAFVGELLYKIEGAKLVGMRRVRQANVVELVSRQLDIEAERSFRAEMRTWLDRLKRALASGHFTSLGQVPAEADLLSRVRTWLEQFAGGQ